jgi:hypothetical protein
MPAKKSKSTKKRGKAKETPKQEKKSGKGQQKKVGFGFAKAKSAAKLAEALERLVKG